MISGPTPALTGELEEAQSQTAPTDAGAAPQRTGGSVGDVGRLPQGEGLGEDLARRLDILAWNDVARALIADFPAIPAAGRNMARLVFLDEAAKDLYPDWGDKARDTVANLRLDAGRHPDDPQLASLINELSLGSDDFGRLWADHDVRGKTRGKKYFAHPQLGNLTLDYVVMRAPDDPDMTMMIYSAPPGSDAAATLQLLASLGQSQPANDEAQTNHDAQPGQPQR